MHLEKNPTYACTFKVQRKEINVVKVRFTMKYSSRKLSIFKVITTACNFWRQITGSFQVMSGNILFLGNKIFEIPPFFQAQPGDLGKKVHACSLRFSALKDWQGGQMPRSRPGGLGHMGNAENLIDAAALNRINLPWGRRIHRVFPLSGGRSRANS